MRHAFPLLLLVPLVSACQRSAEETPVAVENITNTVIAPPAPMPPSDPSAGNDSSAEAAPDRPGLLPAAMQGNWAGVDEDCGKRSAQLRLVVEPTRLRFYESEGLVRGLSPNGQGGYTADIDYSGEGESWRRTQTIKLGPGGDRLIISGMGPDIVRKRCPA